MKKLMNLAAAALTLSALAAPGFAQEKADAVTHLKEGKASFEKGCGFCHSLSRALSKTKSREEWSQAVKRMVTYGAPLDSGQREAVTAYLTAQSSFKTSCNTCHSSLRVLSEEAAGKDWKSTVGRMSAHLKELSKKDKDARQFSDQDVEEIAAFLSIVIPAE